MARAEKTLVIGKHDYKLRTLGGKTGSELWLDLLHIAAVPLETLAKTDELDESAIVKAVAAAIRSLDHATANKFYEAFGPVSTVRLGDRWPTLEGAVFDDHFAGNYIELTEWLVQSVMFNFFGFFADGSLGSLVEKVRAASAMMKPPTSSTT